MSAFVVDNEVLDRVVSTIADQPGIREIILNETGCNLQTAQGRNELAKAMLDLNIRAVQARYGDDCADMMPDEEYRYRLRPARKVQAYKSLVCWLYQCREGDIPETSLLYQTMSQVRQMFAMIIVEDLPEYDKAAW